MDSFSVKALRSYMLMYIYLYVSYTWLNGWTKLAELQAATKGQHVSVRSNSKDLMINFKNVSSRINSVFLFFFWTPLYAKHGRTANITFKGLKGH